MASRFLRTATVTAVAGLCAAAVVALPVAIHAGGSAASAADACAGPTPSSTASSTASPNPLESIIGQFPGSSSSPSATPTASTSPSTSPSSCPSPSPGCASPSASPSASSGGLPIPLPGGSSSPSATPTATTSPSGGCSSCPVVTLHINTPTINATGLASVTVSNATPGSRIELEGYSQNHQGTQSFTNDTTNPDRVGTADSNGTITFNDLRPASNTRLRARQTSTCPYSASGVINVRAQETLQVTRTGTRSYTFSGRSIPARPGGLIVSLYRIVGSSCAAGVEPSSCPGEMFLGQARAVPLGQPNEGLYSIRYTFANKDQNVRDDFVVKTGADAQNAPGRSNVRSLLIY